HELVTAVAHFHDRQTLALPVQQLGPGCLQYGFRQRRRASTEIEHAFAHLDLYSSASVFPALSSAAPASVSLDSSASPSSSSEGSCTRSRPTSFSPLPSLISVTPWVLRDRLDTSDTRVRTRVP